MCPPGGGDSDGDGADDGGNGDPGNGPGGPGEEMDDFDPDGNSYDDEHDVSQQDADMGGPGGDGEPDSFVDTLVLGKPTKPAQSGLTQGLRGLSKGLLGVDLIGPHNTQVGRQTTAMGIGNLAGNLAGFALSPATKAATTVASSVMGNNTVSTSGGKYGGTTGLEGPTVDATHGTSPADVVNDFFGGNSDAPMEAQAPATERTQAQVAQTVGTPGQTPADQAQAPGEYSQGGLLPSERFSRDWYL